MGAYLSTGRMNTLTSMGFSVAESRLALEETKGDVARAAELMTARCAARERRAGGTLARRVNALLQEKRPWNEFFERFLWPEHLAARVQPHQRATVNLRFPQRRGRQRFTRLIAAELGSPLDAAEGLVIEEPWTYLKVIRALHRLKRQG